MSRLRNESKNQFDLFHNKLNLMKLQAQQIKQETTDLNEYVYGLGFRHQYKNVSQNINQRTAIQSPFTKIFEQNKLKSKYQFTNSRTPQRAVGTNDSTLANPSGLSNNYSLSNNVLPS